MVLQEQYFTHADGRYEAAAQRHRSSKPFNLDRLEKNVRFVLVEVVPKITKLLLLLVPVLFRDFVQLFLPAKKKSITGQLALVTGGGNGLGRALCFRLAQEGCAVAVADIDLVGARRTAEEVRTRFGVKANAFHVDVSDYGSVCKMKEDIESALGNVDVLVNNAALLAMLSISEGKPEDIQRIVNVNLLSHFWTIRAFKDGMVERRRGHIVAICSLLGIIPIGRTISYCATKFGVRGLMASLTEEFHLDGLTNDLHTTCVYPAGIRTRKQFIDLMRDLKLTIPVHSPEYVANAIVDAVLVNKTEVIPSSLGVRIIAAMYHIVPRSLSLLVSEIIVGKIPVLTRRG
ncbi:17-beta-hydroxysteroid dehydrogenase 13-like [Armigeres subalbatus]|uniref:17-beta-hydroxysteroid dehydrogenase 13-like n=1 Tax=Armigeres subalbatus TaxID=124917 RepID=UPI002ED3604D